jgi:hypothetical protein
VYGCSQELSLKQIDLIRPALRTDPVTRKDAPTARQKYSHSRSKKLRVHLDNGKANSECVSGRGGSSEQDE